MVETSNSKKVLITEDDRALRTILSDRLRTEGFEVFEATNGEMGVDMVKEFHPHLVLLDIIMPKMNGIEALEEIRRDEDWGERVEVMMLTNLSSEEQKESVARLGVRDYMVKSDWDIEDIVTRVKQKLVL